MINIFDLHNDYLLNFKTDKNRTNYLNKAGSLGLLNVCSAVFTSELDKDNAINTILNANNFSTAQNIYLAIEDLHFISSLYDLDKIIQVNPIYASLTWNHENNLAGGTLSNGGVTLLGENIIKELEKANIQIDTAHLNERSFMDFCKITTKPILCSHTAANTICECKRNLKDYQLKIIAESNGLIGVYFVSKFLSNTKKCNMGDIVSHIDYIVNKIGINYVAIGTDFYGTKDLPSGISSYKDFNKIQNELLKRGYSKHDVDKIFYKNALNFFD